MPQARWYAVHMGQRLRLTYKCRMVVVKVNDRGAGRVVNGIADENRVLDLSRAAYAYLLRKNTEDVNDRNASVIQLEKIELVPHVIQLGPYEYRCSK